MAKSHFKMTAVGFATTLLFAASAGAVESKADCEYEGGEVFPVHNDIVCLVPVRAEQFHDEVYDGEQLGIKDCNGELIADGQFCKITLLKGESTFKTKEEAEKAAREADKKSEQSEEKVN